MKRFLKPFLNVVPAALLLCVGGMACATSAPQGDNTPDRAVSDALPVSITIEGIGQNPEGIEYNKSDRTFLLSSLNAGPIRKVNADGSHTAFTSGEAFPMSTAGLQIDHERGRLLAAAFNGAELFDDDPATKGVSHLRIYDLETGVMANDINLSSLLPDAPMYFANDLTVDGEGNVYVSDWFAGVIYKVDLAGAPSVFWTNQSGVTGGPNGLDFHPDGYLLVSVINDGTYSEHALVKVPLDNPSAAQNVAISDAAFRGFDGMVVTASGKVVGVTNNGAGPGGNVLLELSGNDDWTSATVDVSKTITTSTTVAVTPENDYFVINQDFTDGTATSWTIEQIDLANP